MGNGWAAAHTVSDSYSKVLQSNGRRPIVICDMKDLCISEVLMSSGQRPIKLVTAIVKSSRAMGGGP